MRSFSRVACEPLENRALFALTVQIDYSLDTNNFFDTPEKRALLQTAADTAVARYTDTLAAIVPSGTNTWKAILDHPANTGTTEMNNLTVPANTLLVFAGGRDMSSLGIGGPGGFSSSGTTAWNDLVASRGQPNARGAGAHDFGPYGGSITFDTSPATAWYFGLDDSQINGKNDFYSVALHEMAHLLGFGTSDSWESRVSGSLFTGPAAVGEYDGSGNVPLSSDKSHWASNTTDGGQEAAMDPELTTGSRKNLTALDLAGMDDVGWEIPLSAALSSASSVTHSGASSTSFTVTYTHYTNVDTATIGAGDVVVTGPNGFSAPATLVSTGPSDKSVTATYAIAAPGGSFDGSDSGNYSVSLTANAVGDAAGNFAPAGKLGSFIVDIDAPPTASFMAQNVTTLGAPTHTLMVIYSDLAGIDASSIDTSDLVVTRLGDGLALAVTGASLAASSNNSPRTVTYTLAGPAGDFDAADNGTYSVALAAGQVKDANGTPADAGTLGTFEVAVGALAFSAGNNAFFIDADGGTVVVSLRGAGSGQLLFDNAGNTDAAGISLTGTDPASALTITTNGAGTTLGGLTVNGSLRSFTAKTTDFSGNFSISGASPKILMRNASGSMTLSGSGAAPASITLATVHDLSIVAPSGIRTLKASQWLDINTTPDVIITSTLTSLSVKGPFQADISADVIDRISISGALSGASIHATTLIGSVSAASASDSLIFAGVKSGVTTLPDALDDFANPAATLKSFSLKGKSATFSTTRIAAPTIARATLGLADPSPNSAAIACGVSADRLSSVSGSTTTMGSYRLTRREEPGSGLSVGDFAIVVL